VGWAGCELRGYVAWLRGGYIYPRGAVYVQTYSRPLQMRAEINLLIYHLGYVINRYGEELLGSMVTASPPAGVSVAQFRYWSLTAY
jgi:hypothetical protein